MLRTEQTGDLLTGHAVPRRLVSIWTVAKGNVAPPTPAVWGAENAGGRQSVDVRPLPGAHTGRVGQSRRVRLKSLIFRL